MKIVHHNDADGYAAAYLAYFYEDNFDEVEFIEMNYDREFPFDKINKDEKVIIVDFSLNIPDMVKLANITTNIIWIDHHKSAIEKYDGFKGNIKGIRFDGISGAGLTYLYYARDWKEKQLLELIETSVSHEEVLDVLRNELNENAPRWLILVDDWDVWNHSFSPTTEEFQIAIANKLSIGLFERLHKDENEDMDGDNYVPQPYLHRLISTGASYIEYRNQWSETFMKRYGYETEITVNGRTYKGFVANLGNANSKFFGDKIDKYDFVSSFCYNGELFNYSVYSNKEDVDCSEICKAYGGGGHKGASGFTYDRNIFIKKGDNNE